MGWTVNPWLGEFESHMRSQFYPSIAQSGSASGLGPEGREFESLYSDQRPRLNLRRIIGKVVSFLWGQ